MLHRPKKKKLSAPRVYASLTNLEFIGHVVNAYSQPGCCLPLKDINPKNGSKINHPEVWKVFEDCGIHAQQKMKQAIIKALQGQIGEIRSAHGLG